MDTRSLRRAIGASALIAMTQIGAILPAGATDKLVNLDGIPGNESVVSLTLLSSSPIKVRNKITNKAVGKAFSFTWASAGPGGFSSAAGTPTSPGTASGVGVVWEWKTTSVIYSYTGAACASDICFTQTFPAGPAFGPFGAPGRSLTPSGVTLSSGSLTTSLTTFFSPLNDLTRASSTVEQLESGEFRYHTVIQNLTAHEIVFETNGLPLNPFASGDAKADPGSTLLPPAVTVAPGGMFEECVKSPFPAVEVGFGATICGQDVPAGPDACATSPDPASRGEFRVLVPDQGQPLGSAFITPLDVVVTDPAPGGNGDGLLQPGETASITISVRNAGPVTVESASATLASPPIDLTNDGMTNPIAVAITSAISAYPNLQGTPPSAPPGPCLSSLPAPLHPSSNSSSYVIQIPGNHPRDVGRPFTLSVSGQLAVSHAPFAMTVPIVIAVADDPPAAIPALSSPLLALVVLAIAAAGLAAMRR